MQVKCTLILFALAIGHFACHQKKRKTSHWDIISQNRDGFIIDNQLIILTDYQKNMVVDSVKMNYEPFVDSLVIYDHEGFQSSFAFKNGYLDGSFKVLYPNKKIYMIGSFESNTPKDSLLIFFSNGKLKLASYFYNGRNYGIKYDSLGRFEYTSGSEIKNSHFTTDTIKKQFTIHLNLHKQNFLKQTLYILDYKTQELIDVVPIRNLDHITLAYEKEKRGKFQIEILIESEDSASKKKNQLQTIVDLEL